MLQSSVESWQLCQCYNSTSSTVTGGGVRPQKLDPDLDQLDFELATLWGVFAYSVLIDAQSDLAIT